MPSYYVLPHHKTPLGWVSGDDADDDDDDDLKLDVS